MKPYLLQCTVLLPGFIASHCTQNEEEATLRNGQNATFSQSQLATGFKCIMQNKCMQYILSIGKGEGAPVPLF